MAIILFDDDAHTTLLPLTFTRPVANLRIGILTIAEKWAKRFELSFSYATIPYLQAKFPKQAEECNLLINGSICPDERLLDAISQLQDGGQALVQKDKLIAVKLSAQQLQDYNLNQLPQDRVEYSHKLTCVQNPEDIFTYNDL